MHPEAQRSSGFLRSPTSMCIGDGVCRGSRKKRKRPSARPLLTYLLLLALAFLFSHSCLACACSQLGSVKDYSSWQRKLQKRSEKQRKKHSERLRRPCWVNDDSSLDPSPNSSGRGEEGQGVRVKRPCSDRRTRANASSWVESPGGRSESEEEGVLDSWWASPPFS